MWDAIPNWLSYFVREKYLFTFNNINIIIKFTSYSRNIYHLLRINDKNIYMQNTYFCIHLFGVILSGEVFFLNWTRPFLTWEKSSKWKKTRIRVACAHLFGNSEFEVSTSVIFSYGARFANLGKIQRKYYLKNLKYVLSWWLNLNFFI